LTVTTAHAFGKLGDTLKKNKITEKGPALEHIGEAPHIQGKYDRPIIKRSTYRPV
jgi:hypothetical protein